MQSRETQFKSYKKLIKDVHLYEIFKEYWAIWINFAVPACNSLIYDLISIIQIRIFLYLTCSEHVNKDNISCPEDDQMMDQVMGSEYLIFEKLKQKTLGGILEKILIKEMNEITLSGFLSPLNERNKTQRNENRK